MENATPDRMQSRIAENRRKLISLAAWFAVSVWLVVAIIVTLLTFWLSPFLGVVVGAVVAAIWTTIAWKSAPLAVLDLSDVEPADARKHARLFNAAAALSASTGVAPPEMYIVEDPAINAMATGRNARESSIVVTSGLLDALDVVELEAVLALIFFRIKSGQIAPETFVVPTVGASAVLAEQADGQEWLQKLLFAPLPFIERQVSRLHPADGEFEIDMASTLITRYPPALATALQKMDGRSALALGTAVTAHLWLAPPLNVATRLETAGVHKPLRDRVAVLQEL